jgi:hypothetical protein
VVGYRFQVSDLLEIDQLDIWNGDPDGVTSAHQVGIWDGSQTLIASVTVDAGGTVIGDWTYAAITPVMLSPGQTYTAGALYVSGDGDNYVSGASSVITDPNVTFLNAVYPEAEELGFVFPALDSPGSIGRFGPNFTFTVVPVELQSFTVE